MSRTGCHENVLIAVPARRAALGGRKVARRVQDAAGMRLVNMAPPGCFRHLHPQGCIGIGGESLAGVDVVVQNDVARYQDHDFLRLRAHPCLSCQAVAWNDCG